MRAVANKSSQQIAANAWTKAARDATAIYQDVVNRCPPPPAPGGYGVEASSFSRALPWLRWRELVTCARHFGERGRAVEEIAGQLAAELGRRMSTTGGGATSSRDTGGLRRPAELADANYQVRSQDVAAIACAFAKLNPQSPEYGPVFMAAVEGIRLRSWMLDTLDSVKLATALVDVGMNVKGIFEVLLRPVLEKAKGELQRRGGAEEHALSVDELRFLLHTCGHAPPGECLSPEDLKALAQLTMKRLEQMNFQQAAHMFVNWLRIPLSGPSKQVCLDALASCAIHTHHSRPQPPSHPLPHGGLAPLLEALFVGERAAKQPVTPPVVRAIMYALMQLSRGVYESRKERPRNWQLPRAAFADGQALASASHPLDDGTHAALDFRDWVRILTVVIQFCDAHAHDGAMSLVGAKSSSREEPLELPRYAADALSFVAHRTLLVHHTGPIDLDSLLTFLRMLQTYRAAERPQQALYETIAAKLVEQEDTRGVPRVAGERAKLVVLAEELTSLLPQAQRSAFAKRFALSTTFEAEAAGVADQAARLPGIGGQAWMQSRPLPSAAQPNVALALQRQGAQNREAAAVLGGDRLWSKLTSPAAALDEAGLQAEKSECQLEASMEAVAAAPEQESMAHVASMEAEAADQAAAQVAARSQPSRAEVEELQATVMTLLERIQTLEAKVVENNKLEAKASPQPEEQTSQQQRQQPPSQPQPHAHSHPQRQGSRQSGIFPPHFNFQALWQQANHPQYNHGRGAGFASHQQPGSSRGRLADGNAISLSLLGWGAQRVH